MDNPRATMLAAIQIRIVDILEKTQNFPKEHNKYLQILREFPMKRIAWRTQNIPREEIYNYSLKIIYFKI